MRAENTAMTASVVDLFGRSSAPGLWLASPTVETEKTCL